MLYDSVVKYSHQVQLDDRIPVYTCYIWPLSAVPQMQSTYHIASRDSEPKLLNIEEVVITQEVTDFCGLHHASRTLK